MQKSYVTDWRASWGDSWRIAGALLGLMFGTVGWGDTFDLKSGGEVVGELLNIDEEPRSSYRIQLAAGGEVTLSAADVTAVHVLTDDEKQYEKYLKQMPADNAKNHWKMAEWCRTHHLSTQRTYHLEQILRHEPDHVEARAALEYKRQKDGSWARTEEIWAERGYVREGGKWVLPQQVALDSLEEDAKRKRIEWQKNIRMWRGWLNGRNREKAIGLFMSIDDPLAAEPLVEMFTDDRYLDLRESLAEILARLPTNASLVALFQAAMEGDTELRILSLKLLKASFREQVLPQFVRELSSKDNTRIRHAGFALKQLGDESTLLPLIRAVRTSHSVKIGGNSNQYNINGPNSISMGQRSKVVEKTFDNQEVRDALVFLTNEDFEFNEEAWSQWYANRTTPRVDLRRDP